MCVGLCHVSGEVARKEAEWFNPASDEEAVRALAPIPPNVPMPTDRQEKTTKHAHLKDQKEAKQANLVASKREAQLLHGEPHCSGQMSETQEGEELSLSAFEMPCDPPSLSTSPSLLNR